VDSDGEVGGQCVRRADRLVSEGRLELLLPSTIHPEGFTDEMDRYRRNDWP
jgi:hypothetical protein